jgi:Tfp pilus assembly protein PilE
MKKELPTQKSSGYTIIEILISIFILVILFSAVQAGYRQFILQKSLDTVKSQIMSDIRLAQEYAIAGRKPAGCSGLNGYLLHTYPNSDTDLNYYRIYADCGTDILVKEVYLKDIAKQVKFTGSDPNLLFKVLGAGTNISEGSALTINLEQTGGSIRVITVSSGGEVK